MYEYYSESYSIITLKTLDCQNYKFGRPKLALLSWYSVTYFVSPIWSLGYFLSLTLSFKLDKRDLDVKYLKLLQSPIPVLPNPQPAGNPTYFSIFQPSTAYSRYFLPISAYSKLFQPTLPYLSLLRPIPASRSLFQPISGS